MITFRSDIIFLLDTDKFCNTAFISSYTYFSFTFFWFDFGQGAFFNIVVRALSMRSTL